MNKNSSLQYEKLVSRAIRNISSQRTLDIINARFGLVDGERQTLEAIGQKYGITRERVRQIVDAVFADLKEDSAIDVLKPAFQAIDNYFNEGNPRSIPKIVGFNEHGEELFIWGPRPKTAQDLVMQLISERYSNEEINKELHLWYSQNRGEELQEEFIYILKNITEKLNRPLIAEVGQF